MGPVCGDEADADMEAAPIVFGVNVAEVTPLEFVVLLAGKMEPFVAVQATLRLWTGWPKNETDKVTVAVPLEYIVPVP
jgi:hypothetical protein